MDVVTNQEQKEQIAKENLALLEKRTKLKETGMLLSLQDSPRAEPNLPDLNNKPEPWVCGVCGHQRDPYWVEWQAKWTLYDGDCEQCQRNRNSKILIDEMRQRLYDKYINRMQYKDMTLDNYQPDPNFPSQQMALEGVQQLVRDWSNGMWERGIMLYSPAVGIGKTHLVVSAVRTGVFMYVPRYVDEPILAVWDMPSYIKSIKNTYNDKDSSTETIQRSARVPGILVLDDLGAEYVKTAEWYQGLLYDIFNARWLDNKATLVTTNVEPTTALRHRMGNRAWSRMIALTGRPYEMDGVDYRIRETP